MPRTETNRCERILKRVPVRPRSILSHSSNDDVHLFFSRFHLTKSENVTDENAKNALKFEIDREKKEFSPSHEKWEHIRLVARCACTFLSLSPALAPSLISHSRWVELCTRVFKSKMKTIWSSKQLKRRIKLSHLTLKMRQVRLLFLFLAFLRLLFAHS